MPVIDFRKNAIFPARRSTRCCDAQGAGAIAFRNNAIFPARRGGRVDRDVACATFNCINAIIPGTTRRSTRCCDAQGAGAIAFRNNAIFPARRGGRVDREGRACGELFA